MSNAKKQTSYGPERFRDVVYLSAFPRPGNAKKKTAKGEKMTEKSNAMTATPAEKAKPKVNVTALKEIASKQRMDVHLKSTMIGVPHMSAYDCAGNRLIIKDCNTYINYNGRRGVNVLVDDEEYGMRVITSTARGIVDMIVGIIDHDVAMTDVPVMRILVADDETTIDMVVADE